jgi:hypothetical protein
MASFVPCRMPRGVRRREETVATAVDVHEAPARARKARWSPGRWSGLFGLIGLMCAVLLPSAPVDVETPTVSWPLDATAPRSTLLTTTAHRPLDLDVRFGCDVVRAAQDAGGVVLATVLPESPEASTMGLVVTAADGRLQVRAHGRRLLDDAVPPGPCEYRITGQGSGRPVHVAALPSPATRFDPAVPIGQATPDPDRFAGPTEAELRIALDGARLAADLAAQLPEVAVLVTDVARVPAAVDAPLSVVLRLDDESASRPGPLKIALIAAVLAALLVTAALLLLADRSVPRPRRRPGLVPPRIADLVVPGALVLWLVVAPATDDDGYFATQARNAAHSGDVGNYFQLYDQSFAPFTWAYQGLSWWQQLAGYAPVAQRVPALVAGLLTWLVLRRVLAMVLAAAPGSRRRDRIARAALAVTFLGWWLPYDMGVRPEGVVALCAAATLHLVLVAGDRERLVAAWAACAVAGAGFVAHPSGVVALAPLVAGLPLLGRCVWVPGDRTATILRGLAVGSGGVTALVLGFADGALRDFLRGQVVTESVYPQDGWAEELERYAFLLDQIPMGSYAKRAAVLACLVALGWFAVLALVARARRVAVPAPLLVAGAATALGFGSLAITPSKWTHHFGSLAGVGSVFLAGILVLGVPLARAALDGRRVPLPLALAVAASVVVTAALAWRGPNSWPYAWLDGMPSAYRPPALGDIALDDPLLWALVLAAAAAALVLVRRLGRREALLCVAPAVVALSLAASTTYLLSTFTAAAVAGTPRDSVWAGSFADPTGRSCVVGDALRVLDPFTARPLPGVGPAGPSGIFVVDGGYYPANAPQGTAARRVWGSHVGRDGRSADEPTGTMTTGWYRLPVIPGERRVAVIAAGTLDRGNALTAVYGAGSETVGAQPLTDTAASPSWRTFTLAPPAGADTVRIEATDALAGVHGWLAFSAPVVARPVAVSELVPPTAPVALAWQVAFGFPCLRPSTVVHGLTEPPTFGVLRGAQPLGGLGDIAWLGGRGGVFAQVLHTQSALQLATVAPADPYLQVYVFDTPLARDAYTLTTTPRSVAGASTAVR